MTRNDPVHLIQEKSLSSRRIVITSHLRPDGASLCTSLALAGLIELLGKRVRIINHDPIPSPFNQMPEIKRITIGQVPPRGFDLVILLEGASVDRSGMKHLDRYFKISIDHHFSSNLYADINWLDPSASAGGEMGFLLAERVGGTPPPQTADHLYCAIVSDTGCFQFSNTSARGFEVCYKLGRSGANPIKTTPVLF